jgi:hypothetical protein
MLRFSCGTESLEGDIDIECIVQLHAVADKYDVPVLRTQTLLCFDRVITEKFCLALWNEGKFPKVMLRSKRVHPRGAACALKQ